MTEISNDLIINSAFFEDKDVTEMVRRMIMNNMLYIPSSTNIIDLLGDPAPGKPKKMTIGYTLNGSYHLRSYNELHCALETVKIGSGPLDNAAAYTITALKQSGSRSNNQNPIRINPHCFWTSSPELSRALKQMSKGDGEWNHIEITSAHHPHLPMEYHVIIQGENSQDGSLTNAEKIRSILIQTEPATTPIFEDIDSYLYVHSFRKHPMYMGWWLGGTYSELSNPSIADKSGLISTIMSGNNWSPGHIKRLAFIKYYQDRVLSDDNAGMLIDIYGSLDPNQFPNFKGKLENKDRGLLSYKYTFHAENNAIENYFTEKIIDPILAECLCFYWGCPNLHYYLDPRAYIRLDLDDPGASYEIIQKAIVDDEWSKRIDIIRQEKQKILNHYHIFPYLDKLLFELPYPMYLLIDHTPENVRNTNLNWVSYEFREENSEGDLWRRLAHDVRHDQYLIVRERITNREFRGPLLSLYKQFEVKYPQFDVLLNMDCLLQDTNDSDFKIIRIDTDQRLTGSYVISRKYANERYSSFTPGLILECCKYHIFAVKNIPKMEYPVGDVVDARKGASGYNQLQSATVSRQESSQHPGSPNPKVAVILHLGNYGLWDYCKKHINNVLTSSTRCGVYISYQHDNPLRSTIMEEYPSARWVLTTKGADIGGFIKILSILIRAGETYDYIYKIHTKSIASWRSTLFYPLSGTPKNVQICLDLLRRDGNAMISGHSVILPILTDTYSGAIIEEKCNKWGIQYSPGEQKFVGGTGFWCRWNTLCNGIIKHGIDLDDEYEQMGLGWIAEPSTTHAWERIFGILIYASGNHIASSPIMDYQDGYYADSTRSSE